MHISYFSYLHSEVAAADVLNHYAYPCSWPHQISDLSRLQLFVVLGCIFFFLQRRCFDHRYMHAYIHTHTHIHAVKQFQETRCVPTASLRLVVGTCLVRKPGACPQSAYDWLWTRAWFKKLGNKGGHLHLQIF